MTDPSAWFEANVRAAVANESRRAVVSRAAAAKIAARATATAAVDDFDGLRDLAAAIKRHTIANLDHYLTTFTAAFEANGGFVHRAASGTEANQLIVEIARRSGAQLAVKSKSMTTEETHLNDAFADAGVEIVETDLGEFIVQLDGDRPSHIVAPIIHKDRAEIARTLARAIGADPDDGPEALTRHARRHLRDVFRRCDFGITGVNFAVAETGTIAIATNEGNGRLTTTRPRIHVALMGIEKVIPRLIDLPVMLKVLASSSTGQPLTVYTNLITGPRRAEDPDGPDELHVILLDAGRSAIAASDDSDVLACIRCGACLNACPVFRTIGGHAYEHVYPGPIGALLAPALDDAAVYASLPQASSLCGRCVDVCPVRIDIPRLLVRHREQQVEQRLVPAGRRRVFRVMTWFLASPRRIAFGRRLMRWATPFTRDDAWIGSLPGPLRALSRQRDLPRPAPKSFQEQWRERPSTPTRGGPS